MATIENVIFLISFVASIYCIFMQIYNVISLGKEHELKLSFMHFAGFIMSFGFVLLITNLDPETLVYSSILFYLQGLLILSFVLFFSELLLYFKNNGLKPQKEN